MSDVRITTPDKLAERKDAALPYLERAFAFESQGQFGDAEECYRLAIGQSGDLNAYNRLGQMLHRSGRFDAAVAVFREAIASGGHGYASLHSNLGAVLSDQGCLDEALRLLYRALELDPEYGLAHYNLGQTLTKLFWYDAAEKAYRQALAIHPGLSAAQWSLATLLLRKGNYEEGWRLYESRYLGDRPPVKVPTQTAVRWQGEPLTGRSLIIYPEQGLGDIIQFARYLPLLKKQGLARLDVACDPSVERLRDIFTHISGVDSMVDVSDRHGETGHDYWCQIMSLPMRFGTTLSTIPSELPYLRSEPALSEAWRARVQMAAPREVKIGLVWAGNPHNANDARRSLNIRQLLPLLRIPAITFVSLQKGAATAQMNQLPEGLRPLNLMDQAPNLMDTAAIIQNLDLVISVDTSIAHLAGALGCPVWVLTHYHGCWRWLRGRNDSPWYPKVMRIFRQPTPWDWATPIGEVRRALLDLLRIDQR